jgi:hypothetical protein
MKNAAVQHYLSIPMLRYIRDNQPTEDELLAYLGLSDVACYHVLRKEHLLLLDNGRVILSPQHYTADGQFFLYFNQRIYLNKDQIDYFREDCGTE